MSTASTGGCTVMVIDDDEGIREALASAISEAGCEVLSAMNGRDGLDQLRAQSEPPCLILLDLMMPVMDGQSFRTEQMKDPKLSSIPVIVMTAGQIPSSAMGVTTLRKPLQLEQLLKMVRERCPSASGG